MTSEGHNKESQVEVQVRTTQLLIQFIKRKMNWFNHTKQQIVIEVPIKYLTGLGNVLKYGDEFVWLMQKLISSILYYVDTLAIFGEDCLIIHL